MKSLLVLFINYLNPLPFDMYRYTDINCQITVLFILIIFFYLYLAIWRLYGSWERPFRVSPFNFLDSPFLAL